MKRGIYLLLLLTISFAAAVPTINFQNEETSVGETILGTISTPGNFTSDIEADDLKLYEGRKEVFLELGLFSYDGTYYFYIYATREGNFTLNISDVLYREDVPGSIDLQKSFTISPKTENDSILQIKPGVVFSSEPTVMLTNKGDDNLNISIGGTSYELIPGQTHTPELQATQSFYFLEVSSYKDFSIPIIVLSTKNETKESDYLKTDKTLIHVNLVSDETFSETLTLFNFAEEPITNIEATSGISFVNLDTPENVPAKSSKNITLTFSPTEDGYDGGNITITYEISEESYVLTIPINAYILGENSTESDYELSDETCSGKGGLFCGDNEYCDGEATFTSDEPHYCCLGTCEILEEESESNGGLLIGILIILALGIGGYFLYKKYKKTTPENPTDTIQKTQKTFENRISGKLTRN